MAQLLDKMLWVHISEFYRLKRHKSWKTTHEYICTPGGYAPPDQVTFYAAQVLSNGLVDKSGWMSKYKNVLRPAFYAKLTLKIKAAIDN